MASVITITEAANQAHCSRQAIYKALDSKRLTEVAQLVRGVAVDAKWRTFLSKQRKLKKDQNGSGKAKHK